METYAEHLDNVVKPFQNFSTESMSLRGINILIAPLTHQNPVNYEFFIIHFIKFSRNPPPLILGLRWDNIKTMQTVLS